MNEFKNKVVIVTGISSGIGQCIAKQFIHKGSQVIGIDKDPCTLACSLFYQGDLTEKTVLKAFAEEVLNEYKKIDILINNAGLTKGGLLSCDYENFLYVQKLSLAAPFLLTQLFMNHLGSDAAIINIASTRAFQSQQDWESYAAAKGGIISLTHAMAITLKGKARVNCISPGWIDTINSAVSENDKNQHPAGRIGTPMDIAEMTLFLCSKKAGFMTGENVVIDGGMSKLMIYHHDEGWHYQN